MRPVLPHRRNRQHGDVGTGEFLCRQAQPIRHKTLRRYAPRMRGSSNHKSRAMFTGSPAFAGDDETVCSAQISTPRSFTMPLTRRAFAALGLALAAAPAKTQQLDKGS